MVDLNVAFNESTVASREIFILNRKLQIGWSDEYRITNSNFAFSHWMVFLPHHVMNAIRGQVDGRTIRLKHSFSQFCNHSRFKHHFVAKQKSWKYIKITFFYWYEPTAYRQPLFHQKLDNNILPSSHNTVSSVARDMYKGAGKSVLNRMACLWLPKYFQ